MIKTIFKIKAFRSIFIGFLFLLSLIQGVYANLVVNPFFTGTTTAATNWTSSATGAGAAFNSNTRAVNETITAAGGSTEYYSGCVGAACLTFPFVNGRSSGSQQTINAAVGTTYTLSFMTYFSTASNATVEVDAYWGSTKVYAGTNVITAGWSLQTVSLGTAAQTSYTLTTLVRDDPDYSAITFMDVEPVVLRLAKTNPASFAVGVAANYNLTISNVSTISSGSSFTLLDQLPANIQYNSVAFGAGLTGASCVASGTVAAGQLLTCTISAAAGIPAGSTGLLTINVTPQAASAGVARSNKASVQVNGGVPNITGTTTPPPSPATPSTCTGTDTPTLGCAVAASITPTSAQLTFTKTASLICDPVNGTTNPKNIPGAIVRWTMTVTNSGIAPVSLTTVSDLLSANTTIDPNLITGSGTVTGCNSLTGVPENATGNGFKLSVTGSRPAASYPKFFTTIADVDAASISSATVSINYALGMPAEGVIPNVYSAGQLNTGESVIVYFNITIN